MYQFVVCAFAWALHRVVYLMEPGLLLIHSIFVMPGRLSSSWLPMGGRQGQRERHRRLRKSTTPKNKTTMMICHHSRQTQTGIDRLTCIPTQRVILILKLVDDLGIGAVDDVCHPIYGYHPPVHHTWCIYACRIWAGHDRLVAQSVKDKVWVSL